MKGIALFFITMVVGIQASPTLQIFAGARQERIVTGAIIQAIEDIAQGIRDAGFDPWNVNMEMKYESPIPVLFAASAVIDNFVTTGLSDITVNSMNYYILSNRLTFDISLPSIFISADNASFDVTLFGDSYAGAVSGSVVISQIRVTGEIRISIGIITGISVRSISLNFTLGGITSNLNLSLFGYELSEQINSFLGEKIPSTLTEFADEINELLVLIAWQIVDLIL